MNVCVPGQYRWSMANELMVLSGPPGFGLAFGGGGGGFGLHLDDDLDNGASSPCATFANKKLSSAEFFKTLNVEVWRLDACLPVQGLPVQAHGSAARQESGQVLGGGHGQPATSGGVMRPGLLRRVDSASASEADLEFGDV